MDPAATERRDLNGRVTETPIIYEDAPNSNLHIQCTSETPGPDIRFQGFNPFPVPGDFARAPEAVGTVRRPPSPSPVPPEGVR